MPPTAATIVTTDAPSPVSPAPARSRWSPWLPACTVLVAVAGALLWTDTAAWDVARYALYAAWAVVLPGVLVYRALRHRPHSLIDDLAMGAAVGLVLEIPAFVLFSITDLRGLLWLWPLLVVVPFGAVPGLRRHWWPSRGRPDCYRPAPAGWAWFVAGTAIYLVGYLTFAYLRVNQPVPMVGSQAYFIDQPFFLTLVAEAKHHFPLTHPGLAGQSLSYHWFAFANMASASLITGVDTPVIVFRLALPALSVLAVVLLAVLGWRISGRPWVGAVASALTFAIGELVLGTMTPGSIGGITTFLVWGSLSLVYGHVIMFALVALVAARIMDDGPAGGRGDWVLLGLFAVAAPGAKATVMPVVLGGLALALLIQHRRRRPTATLWRVAGVLLGAQIFGTLVLYRFESLGLEIRPASVLGPYVIAPLPPGETVRPGRPWWGWLAVGTIALIAYPIFMFTRLAGIGVLARLRRTWNPVEWFLLGVIGSGFAATLLLYHSGFAQNYFLRSGWAAGAILSAMGLVALIDRQRVPPRTVTAIVVAELAAVAVVSVLLWRLGAGRTGLSWRALLPVLWMGFAVAALAALTVGGVRLAARRDLRLRRLSGVAVLLLLLSAGLPELAWDALRKPNGGRTYHIVVSAENAAAARELRARSDPDDILATNAHCVPPPATGCLSVSYWLSAFAERRVLLESWGYSAQANRVSVNPGLSPFADQDLLTRNLHAFVAPTPELMDWLWQRGVRWLVVDRRFGHESEQLPSYASLVIERGDLAVYRLHPR